MLTSEKKPNHTLTIKISDAYSYLVKVTVFDSNNRIVESQSSSRYAVTFSLAQGLFTLRIEMNGAVLDEVIHLDKDKVYLIADRQSTSTTDIKIISPPTQYSSALLGETYGSSHEYYTYPAIDCSKKDTFITSVTVTKDSNSSLFIFLRFPSLKKFESYKKSVSKPFFYDFEIVNEYGECLTSFKTRNGIEINEQYGWVAFSSKLPNGIYYLIYRGSEQRQIPIYVFKNWHTQFFMTLSNEPLYGTIRIFLSERREFNPNDITYKFIDVLLDKLQNGDYSLDSELIEMSAYNKFGSPILGLICTYIYLKSKDTKSDSLFKTITQNMRNVILKDNTESPDLRALDILASYHFPNYNYEKTRVQGTPMFRIGFETILRASVEDNQLISQNDNNDYISENLYFDSPFNTFKPIPFSRKTIQDQENIKESLIKKKLIKKSIKGPEAKPKEIPFTEMVSFSKDLNPVIIDYSKSIRDLFNVDLFNIIQNKKEADLESSWIKSSIADIIKSGDSITINEISNYLGVSGNTVIRIFNEWEKEAKKIYPK